MQYKNRVDVPDKYKWDLTDFFKNEKEFNKTFKDTKKNIDKLPSYKGKLKDANQLYKFMELEVEAISKWQNLYVYSYLINDQELGNTKSIERKEKCEKLNVELCNNISFYAPELLKLTKEEYNNLFIDNPKLNEFKFDLDKTFRRKEHVLAEEKEIIVNNLVQATNHFEDIYSNLKNNEIDYGKINIDGKEIVIAPNNYRKLMKNKDELIRREIYEKFHSNITKHSTTFASLLNSYVSMKDKLSNIYNFSDTWNEKLFQYNFTNKVYESLVGTVLSNIKPINRYFELKKKVLNKKVLKPWDLRLDIVNNSKKYTIEEAQELCLKAIKPLGEEYYKKFKKIFTNRYIDYCQYKGKQSGGYSFSTMLTDSRVLMSFNDDLESVSTIIHEGGHNVNHQFMKENNSLIYRNNESVVAEVASLTNECLLSMYLAKHGKTKEEKLSGLKNIMDVIVSNLYGAVREGKIEQDFYELIHKGEMLTVDFLNKETSDSLKKFYGENVETDDYIGSGWISRSHYYMTFYLYSYAISISVATSLANKILNNDKVALNNYIEFLKCGSNNWPQDTFKILGINLEDKTVYEDACNYLDKLIDKYYEVIAE